MIIKILGTGCRKCDKLEDNTKLAIEELKVDASIEKVTDFKDIMKYGVMQTPALVVDEKVEAVGKSLSTKEIKQILSKR
ncbi:MAG TPA: thioredoxin family protein [Tissierellaceae bacterium]|nr:thioredoxin family protein [Tissierellaceae bacterium]